MYVNLISYTKSYCIFIFSLKGTASELLFGICALEPLLGKLALGEHKPQSMADHLMSGQVAWAVYTIWTNE